MTAPEQAKIDRECMATQWNQAIQHDMMIDSIRAAKQRDLGIDIDGRRIIDVVRERIAARA